MIVEVLRSHGATVPDRAGRFPVACPYHSDSVKSGFVDVHRDTFTCFACGVRGSAVSLVQQREGLSADAAQRVVEELAGKGHVSVRESPKRAGTFVPFRTRDQRVDSKKIEDRRRRFPFA